MKSGHASRSEELQSQKPLEGLRVLAVEQVQSLPYATQLMAFLGAEVVKVEPPGTGESGRQSQHTIVDDDGNVVGATYMRSNLSKKSIAIDLRDPEGKLLFRRLVPHFDVVAENFKPGTMEKLGLGYRDLAGDHPSLIYVSVSGFGSMLDSPYRTWPAYAPVVQAMAGLFESIRKPGEYPLTSLGGAIGDIAAALFAAVGALAAVVHRQKTGRGQWVDVSMYDAALAMADMVPFMWSLNVEHPGRKATGVVQQFRAKDGFFIVVVLREHQFERLAHILNRPEWLSDPRLATRSGWVEHLETVIRPAVEEWAKDKTKLEAARELCDAGIAAGPNNDAEAIVHDPHVRLHHMLLEIARPDGGRPLLVTGNPIKMSAAADGPVTRWPKLGEHTVSVLQDLLDVDDDEVARLLQRGVIAQAGLGGRP